MSLNVKNPAVVELTRELAQALGTTQVSALEIALREKLERLASEGHQPPHVVERRRRIDESVARLRALVGPNPPTRQEIDDDLYDEHGLPR